MRKNYLMMMLVLIALIPQHSEARKSGVFSAGIRYGRTDSGYVYMNGGLDIDEQQIMERRSAAFNLKLVLMTPLAMPVPPLRVFLANNSTGTIEQILLSGPWIYFQLPPGTYTIGARISNKFFLLRNVHVQDTSRHTYILRGNLLPSIMNSGNGGAR